MPALSFKRRFGKAVENGLAVVHGQPLSWADVEPKLYTVRKRRRVPIEVGDKLVMYEQQRSPHRRHLGEARCLYARELIINSVDLASSVTTDPDGREVRLRQRVISVIGSPYDVDGLARLLGFVNLQEMVDFYKAEYGLPFVGVLHSWDPARPWEKG